MTKRLAMLLIVGLATVLPLSIRAVSNPAQDAKCETIDGTYQRSSESSPDKLVMTLTQTACEITGVAPSKEYDHNFKGKWSAKNGGFDITITRIDKTNSCVTKMYGYLYRLEHGNVLLAIDGTDGKCNLKADYHEKSVFAPR
jgi:hypothetical protein